MSTFEFRKRNPKNMIERFERFSFAVSEMSKYWHRIAGEEMEKYGLKGTHSVYLLSLYKSENGLTAGQMCEICGKDKSDVSRMMMIMQERGLVVKKNDGDRLYRAHYYLTDAGKKAAKEVCLRAARAVEIGGGDVSAEKREIFYETMETIVKNLRILSEKGIPTE